MIEFNCASCGNHFRVQPNAAGRHGWCKICHGFILVPTVDENGLAATVTLQDRARRLEQLLREAGTRYERLMFKIALVVRKYHDAKERAQAADTAQLALAEAKGRLAQLEQLQREQTDELRQAVSALREAREEALRHADIPISRPVTPAPEQPMPTLGAMDSGRDNSEIARLKAEQGETASALQLARSQVSTAHERFEALTAALEDKSRALGAFEARAESDRREIDRLRSELHTALESLSELEPRTIQLARDAARFEAAERDRAALAERLDQSEAQVERLRRELANLTTNSESAPSRAAQATLDLDRLRTQVEDAQRARADAESALRDAVTRAERADAHAVALANQMQSLEANSLRTEHLETELHAASVRMGELETLLERLTPDLSAASQALGAYESRAERTARDLERLRDELVQERETLPRPEPAAPRVDIAGSFREPPQPAPTPKAKASNAAFVEEYDDDDLEFDDGELTLVPEILDDTDAEQAEMVNVLLRFLEPDNEKKGS